MIPLCTSQELSGNSFPLELLLYKSAVDILTLAITCLYTAKLLVSIQIFNKGVGNLGGRICKLIEMPQCPLEVAFKDHLFRLR